MASATDLSEYEKDPRLFLFTSLTAGSSHIITATSRMETILKANRIPFQAIDMATDEKARRLWQRRAQKKKLPGLVKDGFVIADLDEVEEWNEFGELKENIGPVPAGNAVSAGGPKGVNIAPAPPVIPTASQGAASKVGQPTSSKAPQPLMDQTKMRALPGAAEIAAINKAKKEATLAPVVDPTTKVEAEASPVGEPAAVETTKAAPAEKEESINAASEVSTEVAHAEPVVSAPAEKEEISDTAKQASTEVEHAEPMATAPAEKEESIKVAKEISKHHPSLDHLSAPSSAIQSGTVTPQPEVAAAVVTLPVEPVPPIDILSNTHRGSEVKEASAEEIQKLEAENTLHEEEEEEEDHEVPAKDVENLKIAEAEAEKMQEQSAKGPEDAGKSVEA